MTEIRDFFEAAYNRHQKYWWNVPYAYSTEPDDLAPSLLGQATLRFALDRAPGRAIDIGSGEGADAIRLARLGWHVEAVELTSAGCDKIRSAARSMDVDIVIQQASIYEYTNDGKFDLVLCNGVLHYIEDKDSACSKLQDLTAPLGATAISLWSNYTPVPDFHRIMPVYPDDEYGDVYRAYLAWKKLLLYFERGRIETGHDDMPQHVHSHIKMLAIRS